MKKGISDPVPSFFSANGASPQGFRRVRADQVQHWLDSDNLWVISQSLESGVYLSGVLEAIATHRRRQLPQHFYRGAKVHAGIGNTLTIDKLGQILGNPLIPCL